MSEFILSEVNLATLDINIGSTVDVRHWAHKFGISTYELIEAITNLGSANAEEVDYYLNNH